MNCEICGEEMVKVSGYVCPNGHGKIHPPPPPPPPRPRGRPRIEELPNAIWLDGVVVKGHPLLKVYRIDNLDGHYRRFDLWLRYDNSLRLVTYTTPGIPVKARLNGKVHKFVRIENQR